MEINREEIIEILGNMGVELPVGTKLPLFALQQRLTRALDLAQAPLNRKEIKPEDLKKWSTVSKARRLIDMMGTISWKEAGVLAGSAAGPPEFLNAFMDLRNAVATIGGNWDDGSKLAVVEDEARTYGFTMRVRTRSFFGSISR